MAVTTETKTGTIAEEEGRKNISPSTKARTPAEAEVSPEDEPRFTQNQLDALIRHALDSEVGRTVKPLEEERNTLKGEVKKLTGSLADIQAERDSLREEIEGLTKDDPKKFDLIKKDRDLRDRERKYKDDLNAFENEKTSHAETVKIANDTMREIHIWEIASEYEDADPVKLKALCDTFEANSEEQIRKAADTIWTKLAMNEEGEQGKKSKVPAPKLYSGKSGGGSPYIKQSEINALWAQGKSEEILKAQKEGRIKLNE